MLTWDMATIPDLYSASIFNMMQFLLQNKESAITVRLVNLEEEDNEQGVTCIFEIKKLCWT
jgi:hypothetical protein